jgi:hypothetical protein
MPLSSDFKYRDLLSKEHTPQTQFAGNKRKESRKGKRNNKRKEDSSSSSGWNEKDHPRAVNGMFSRGSGYKSEGKEDDAGGVRDIQEMLKRKGYDLGKAGVDGKFGPKTEAAVRKFQKDNGMKVTGEIGESAVAKLKSKKKVSKAIVGSVEHRANKIGDALRERFNPPNLDGRGTGWLYVTATFDDRVVFNRSIGDGPSKIYQAEYAIEDGRIIFADPIEVEIMEAVVAKSYRSPLPLALRGKEKGSDKTTPAERAYDKVSSGRSTHGPSIKFPRLYKALRRKGYTKEKAARISNAAWAKKHGKPTPSLRGAVQ